MQLCSLHLPTQELLKAEISTVARNGSLSTAGYNIPATRLCSPLPSSMQLQYLSTAAPVPAACLGSTPTVPGAPCAT